MNAIEIAAKENLESQRRQCIVEHKKKYERHCIASKLVSTQGGGCRINGKSGQFNGSNEVQKVAKTRTPSEKIGIGDSFKVNNAGIASNVHCWKEKTISQQVTACSMVWMSTASVKKESRRCVLSLNQV